jgi:hypothetical protein
MIIQSPPVYINREVIVEKEVIVDHYITNIEEILVKIYYKKNRFNYQSIEL